MPSSTDRDTVPEAGGDGRPPFDRRTTAAATVLAWVVGVGTGIFGTRAYLEVTAPRHEIAAPIPTAPIPPPLDPAPREPEETVMPMQSIYTKICPHVVVEELRIRDGEAERQLQITFRMDNEKTNQACDLAPSSLLLRDSDGRSHAGATSDQLAFPPLSSRRVRLRYRIPKSSELVKLIIGDPTSPSGTLNIDLTRRCGR